MDEVGKAKALIDSIRREIRVDEPESIVYRALSKALKMISEELYSKPTHFIVELIQNADDNRYEKDTAPKLTFVFHENEDHDAYLWVGCNEEGFKPQDVRAICTIAESTKNIDDQRKRTIGEKGIGFKSVFKVADIVWIKSNAFSFKFDNNERLGMIAPVWTEFPSNPLVNERTMFCFHIPRLKDQGHVRDGLLNLKPELLLFLRQLRAIEVTVQASSSTVSTHFTLNRTDSQVLDVRLTKLKQEVHCQNTSTMDEYLVFECTAFNMPPEEKRREVVETEVLIAFPIDPGFNPTFRSCMTYNFLPIRSYGFTFILQGDFILSASREDIRKDNKWNEAIISAAIELFICSVDEFNKKDLLRYTWPRYAQFQGMAHGTIFESFPYKLLQQLQTRSVLYSQDETLNTPASLKYIPFPFKDKNDPPTPLLCNHKAQYQCASTRYKDSDLDILEVPCLDAASFASVLTHYVNEQTESFRGQSETWHRNVAEALMSIGSHKFSQYGILDLRLIHLQSGSWVSGNEWPFYFTKINGDLVIPNGLDIAIISRTASKSHYRRKLYEKLGAETLDCHKVFKLILQQHKNIGTSSWEIADLVSHARFLYHAPHFLSISDMLLAAHEEKTLFHGEDLYMDDPNGSFRFTDVYGPDNSVIRRLHEAYLIQDSADHGLWLTWLQKHVRVQTLPRLTRDGMISTEFSWLLRNKPSSFWLLLLRDNWKHYESSLVPNTDKSRSSSPAKDFLAKTHVLCTNGKYEMLREVYLPNKSINSDKLSRFGVPMLAVGSPDDNKWTSLKALGLGISRDLRFYLTILGNLPSLSPQSFILEDVKQIYTEIQSKATGSNKQRRIRLLFQHGALVYIGSLCKWVSLDTCRWKASRLLSNITPLYHQYPDLAVLFVEVLKVKDANKTDTIHQLCDLSGDVNNIVKIESLLQQLTSCESWTQEEISSLDHIRSCDAKIFPVRTTSGDIDLRSVNDSSWFIADTDGLRTAFERCLPLLGINPYVTSTLGSLIEKLGLGNRRLSVLVDQSTEKYGEEKFQTDLTDLLRSNAQYIGRLAASDRYESVVQQLMQMQFLSVDRIFVRRWIQTASGRVYGREEKVKMVVQEGENDIRIYLLEADMEKQCIPYKRLCNYLKHSCFIDDSRGEWLLALLVTKDPEDLEKMLESENILPNKTTLTGTSITELAGEDDKDEAAFLQPSHHAKDFGSSAAGVVPNDEALAASSSAVGKLRTRTARFHSAHADFQNVIGMPKNLAVAQDFDFSTISMIGFRKMSDRNPGSTTPNSHSTQSTEGSITAHSGSFLPPRAIDMSSMKAALDAAASTSPVTAINRHCGRSGAGYVTPEACEQASERQKEIGYKGETFVYELLVREFGVAEESWTSCSRTHFGLEPFEGSEGDYSDFTICDPAIGPKLTAWLIRNGKTVAKQFLGQNIIYHIEVKTTTGRCDEPFIMSNSQVEHARRWHFSTSDVYIILRVYRFTSDTRGITAYIDPFGLMLNDELAIRAKGDYYVTPI